MSLKTSASPEFWENLLLCWLHDPFDKALDIRGHEGRAAKYASAALGRKVSSKEIRYVVGAADPSAAIAERIPMPTAGIHGERAVGPEDGLCLIHPTSASRIELGTSVLAPDHATNIIERIVTGLTGPRERFLALWRLLPDQIAEEFGGDMARLPADSRIPDHTLFQHADITAGLHAALTAGHGSSFLSFVLGPVQPFIAAARSVRDLWSGSALLSWLVFQAMKPVLEQLGPTAFVYPSLRGAPLADLWLRNDVSLRKIDLPRKAARMAPSLPNRFVAVVPCGANGEHAETFRQECIKAAQNGWRRLAHEVHEKLAPQCSPLAANWDRLWNEQIENALDFQASVLPEREIRDDELAKYLHGDRDFNVAWPNAGSIRSLANIIPHNEQPGYSQSSTGRWQALMEMSAGLMAATRSVRHVPETSTWDTGPVPGKCTLFGSWEQMGPPEFDASRTFWKQAADKIQIDGVRIRLRERLCAVALAKRFAGPSLLASELCLENRDDLRFPDTATVAAAKWLEDAGIDPEKERNRYNWNGQWLHWHTPNQEDNEPRIPDELWKRLAEARKQQPPTYYAVIAMDGDEMGHWLAGEKMPVIQRLLHPKLRTYFEGIDGAEKGLNARRPVGPALHAAISAALASFASEIAPEIVKKHYGTVIYSGGDDLLALCPVEEVLGCVRSLRNAFSGEDDDIQDGWRNCNGRRRITMGRCASMSAGVALVHFKEDLREALRKAHSAEQQAKDAGRDLLTLTVARRSGETSNAICPWPLTTWLDDLRKAFVHDAPNRWTYKLRSELPTLAFDQMPPAAIKAEIRRLIDHGSEGGRVKISGEEIAEQFERYCEYERSRRGDSAASTFLQDFVTLCQSAAFIARGRDA